MVEQTRTLSTYRPKAIPFNEDDHFHCEKPAKNMLAGVRSYASCDYYDAGPGSGGYSGISDYIEGYQNVPVNWSINTPVKRGFFTKLCEITRICH